MNLEERLEALAAYHEDAAKSVRTTLALLMNGARATASKSLGAKLKTAIALRHGNGSVPPEPEEEFSPMSPGLRRGSDAHRIVAWLATQDPQSLASIRRHVGNDKVSMDHMIKRGVVSIAQANKRPYTYTATAKGRSALAHLQARPGKARKGKRSKRKGTARPMKGAFLPQLREAMHGLKAPVDWAELQAVAKEKGLTFSSQTIGSAIRYGHVKATGPAQHRRYTWAS